MPARSNRKVLPTRLAVAWVLGLVFVFAAYLLSGLETMIMAVAVVAVAAIVVDRLGVLGGK